MIFLLSIVTTYDSAAPRDFEDMCSLRSATMGEWPWLLAMDSGIDPSFAARLTSAPFSSNSRAASTWPFRQAMYSGVTPYLFARSTSAPSASSDRAASTSPFWQARYSGVGPCSSGGRFCGVLLAAGFFAAGFFFLGGAAAPDDFFLLGGIAVREWAASAARSGTLSEAEPSAPLGSSGDALPRTLVAQDRTVLERARECSVDESRSAIPGQGGDTKLMALHMLSGGKRTKRCPLLSTNTHKAAHPCVARKPQ